MELVSRTINVKEGTKKPIVIAPLGDFQFAGKSSSTAIDTLKRHIEKCQELGAYYIGMGDAIDLASPSNRQRILSARLYDTATDVIEEKAMDLVHELYEGVLKPTRGKWLGWVQGHHWYPLKAGDTTDMRLCQLLDTTFLGTSAFIRLQLRYRKDTSQTITCWVHHGCGGGVKASSPLNKLENILPYWDADLFFIGHSTKQASAPINRVSARWDLRSGPALIHRKILMIGTGSFSKSYIQGAAQGQIPRGGYAEEKMLNPNTLGAPIVYVRPTYETSQQEGKKHSTLSYQISVEL